MSLFAGSGSAPGWPAHLAEGRVGLRPIRRRDAAAWRDVRSHNVDWLRPWEATSPSGEPGGATFRAMVSHLLAEARAGRMLPFVVTYDGALVGQLTVGGVTWGSLASAHIGYWVDSRVAGRGIIPTAVAMAVDHCFFRVGLHRIEINVRPENAASLRVPRKLGLRDEGIRERLLHIDGAWRDHRSFAVTAEEVPAGLLARWRASAGRPEGP